MASYLKTHQNTILLAILLTLIAAVPRLYNLGELGFYMDEETTAFAARSYYESGKPAMPSGLPYYRALPHTWLIAQSIKLFGVENELSYRLPGAIFGILTIPLLFLLARRYTGTHIAFLAALLLALSEWHIITSRQARMYAPMLFFYLACVFAILRWSQQDNWRNLLLAAATFIATVSFHRIGVFAAAVPFIALHIKGFSKTSQIKLILFGLIGGAAAYYIGNKYIGGAYSEWKAANSVSMAATDPHPPSVDLIAIASDHVLHIIFTLGAGLWLATRQISNDSENGKEFRILARYTLSLSIAGLIITGNMYGAVIAIMFYIMLADSTSTILKNAYASLGALFVTAGYVSAKTILDNGLHEGLKQLLSFPYPGWLTLFDISFTLTAIFTISASYYLLASNRSDRATTHILISLAIFPVVLAGIAMKWPAARYLIQSYTFILIIAMYGLTNILHSAMLKFGRSHHHTICIAILSLFILIGLITGHGITSSVMVATATYKTPFNEAANIFPIHPDHKTTGQYISDRINTGETVIAEDALSQRWYARTVDIWLRKFTPVTGGAFTYPARDHKIRDIYTNSILASQEELNKLTLNKMPFWLVTSGETLNNDSTYLTEYQLAWKKEIQSTHTPVFIGLDGITQVFHVTPPDQERHNPTTQ